MVAQDDARTARACARQKDYWRAQDASCARIVHTSWHTSDVIKSLQFRLEYLENMGVLTPCVDDPDCLLVQLLADASQIFRAKNTNATAMCLKPIYDDSHMLEEDADLVNSRFNLVLVALYRKDDFLS